MGLDAKSKALIAVGVGVVVVGGYLYLRYRSDDQAAQEQAAAQPKPAKEPTPAVAKAPATSAPTAAKPAAAAPVPAGPKLSPEDEAKRVAALKSKDEGNLAHKNNQFLAALEHYTAAINQYPLVDGTLAIFYGNRAATYMSLEQYQNAVEDATASLKADPNYLKSHVRRAKALELLQKPLEACLDYSIICVKEGFSKSKAAFSPDAETNMERLLKQVGHAEAEKIIATRQQFLPSPSVIHNYLDSFNHDAFPGESETVANLSEQISNNPSDPNLFIRRALANIGSNNFDDVAADVDIAVSLLRGQESPPTDQLVLALDLQGTFLYLYAHLDKAYEVFEEVLRLDANRAPTYIRSSVIAFERHHFEEAIDKASTAVKLAPQNPDVYLQRGQLYMLAEKPALALTDFDFAVSLKPTTYMAYVQQALINLQMGNVAKGLSLFEDLIKNFPENPDAFNCYAQVLLDMSKLDEGEQILNKALSINPKHTGVYMQLAILSAIKQDFNSAIATIQKAVEIDPKLPTGYDIMGRLALQMGNHADAIKYFTKAMNYARNIEELAGVCSTKHATEIQLQALTAVANVANVPVKP